MSQEQELQRLEEAIGKVLKEFDALKKENEELQETLRTQEETIADLREQLESSGAEKLEVGDRLSQMLQKITDWEQGIARETEVEDVVIETAGDTVDEQEDEELSGSDPSRQGTLFKVADDM